MKNLRLLLIGSILYPILSLAITKEQALDNFVNNYPKAQIVDLYKTFFQDNFGPGHLLEDSVAAYKYFLYELQDKGIWGGPTYEYTGEGKNFIRLNMDLIRKEVIPADVFFRSFMNSVGRVESPSEEYWISEWLKIDSLVKAKNYHFVNEDNDRDFIKRKLEERNFPIHHSDNFNENYNFHYRIISLQEFLKLKEKYLSDSSDSPSEIVSNP